MAKLYAGLPIAGTIVAAVLVVVLANQKQMLSARVRDLEARMRDPYPGFLVPPVTATTLSGDTVIIAGATSAVGQLLFVFHPECQSCIQSLPAWDSIHDDLGSEGRIQILGVSIDSTEATHAFVAERQLRFPVVSLADRRVQALYRLRLIPHVLLIDADGRVWYARPGALGDVAAVDSVLSAVAARLSPAND